MLQTPAPGKTTVAEVVGATRGPLSPLDLSELSRLLTSYKDKDFVLKGFSEGFRLAFRGSSSSTEEPNSSSVKNNLEEALKKVTSECELHRIAGLFFYINHSIHSNALYP